MSAAFSISVAALEADLCPYGLHVLGQVAFEPGEGPKLESGRPARSLVLVGNAGGSLWPVFSRWLDENPQCREPLDTWSKRVIGPVSQHWGGTVFFPSDPPYQPFQRWAVSALGLKASPLGILMHPQYGLWFGFRGAIAFDGVLEQSSPPAEVHACDTCVDKPCLGTCPVGAIRQDGFAISDCRGHLVTGAGQAGCMTGGCAARNACPVAAGYRYPEGQIRFHMQALNLPDGTDG